MPQTFIKSTEDDGLSKLDALFTQLRHEAAHGRRPWELRYEKSELGSELSLHIEPAEESKAG